MIIALVILGTVVVVLLGLLLKRNGSDSGSALLLKQDLNQLSQDISLLKDGLQTQLSERLDKNSQQMTNQFQESAKIIRDVTQKLTTLEKTNQQVGDIASELKLLQNVLTNPKQRGVLGEYYLNQVLENVLPPDRFVLQYGFSDGQIVDAIIKLDDKILPIDSKFSLENYNRMLEEPDKLRRQALAKNFKADLKNRIDETAKYIRPAEGTMDYAFMFIPSEAIYYDLLTNKVGTSGSTARDLLEYSFRDKHVIIVSPTTFMAYLQTVMQGLRALQIEKQAQEIQLRIGQLGRHLSGYKMFMLKLGNSLGSSVGHFNAASKEFKKVDTDIYKISGTAVGAEPVLLDRPTQLEDQ
ncbi:MAG TPA: DNA recombination protein RmuC [Candidatus Dormibacteraeota bacterium]|nr:DNA recombination protein RmuC [Candidatus Dormibacteraeota bacterium]